MEIREEIPIVFKSICDACFGLRMVYSLDRSCLEKCAACNGKGWE